MFDSATPDPNAGGSTARARGIRSLSIWTRRPGTAAPRWRMTTARDGRAAAGVGAVFALALGIAGVAEGASEGDAARYSHTGFKGAIAVGTVHPASKLHLDDASSAGLAFGYGIDPNFTVWLNLSGSEHERDPRAAGGRRKTALGVAELAVQYRFLPVGTVQPYARIGLGAGILEETDTHNAKAGGAFSFGIGADAFFTRHFGVGAEVTYRSLSFSRERTGEKGDFREMEKNLEGHAAGIALSFTVQ